MNRLLTVGLSHHTAPVALRERLALPPDGGPVLGELAACDPSIGEMVATTTCNRTEVSVVTSDPAAAADALLGVLARRAHATPDELGGAVYRLGDEDAARHLLRVAAGLESMVVGEAEILGQLRRAHQVAAAVGLTGPTLDRLYSVALRTGGRVRAETSIGHGNASVSSLAVTLAQREIGGLDGLDVVMLGAGETAELAARAFHRRGAALTFVANSNLVRPATLAEEFGGAVARRTDLPGLLERADVLVGATAAPGPFVDRETVAAALPARAGKPLLLIDLAVPRDIDPGCEELDGVSRFDLDAMQQVVDDAGRARAAAAADAELIVDDELGRFMEWRAGSAVAPTIAALHRHADSIVDRVLTENAGRWEAASPADLARVEAIARAVATRLLHEPSIRLRGAVTPGHHAGGAELLRELFGLGPADDEPREGAGHDLTDRSGRRP